MTIAATLQKYLADHNVGYDLVSHEPTMSSMRTAEAGRVPGDRLDPNRIVVLQLEIGQRDERAAVELEDLPTAFLLPASGASASGVSRLVSGRGSNDCRASKHLEFVVENSVGIGTSVEQRALLRNCDH